MQHHYFMCISPHMMMLSEFHFSALVIAVVRHRVNMMLEITITALNFSSSLMIGMHMAMPFVSLRSFTSISTSTINRCIRRYFVIYTYSAALHATLMINRGIIWIFISKLLLFSLSKFPSLYFHAHIHARMALLPHIITISFRLPHIWCLSKFSPLIYYFHFRINRHGAFISNATHMLPYRFH